MNLADITKFADKLPLTPEMPVLFLGHGNPMHAISHNHLTDGWKNSVADIEKPVAILCISAHWETNGFYVTSNPQPPTIHDFGGFPQELFAVKYPVPGYPELANYISETTLSNEKIYTDSQRGLDHGCWSVIKHMFPQANIPVIQLSISYNHSATEHFQLAKLLLKLRSKGILIVGSGNIVHNLRLVDWNMKGGFDWAVAANDEIKRMIIHEDFEKLNKLSAFSKACKMAVPTTDHYYPLNFIMGLKTKKDGIYFFNDEIELGSISMTSIVIR